MSSLSASSDSREPGGAKQRLVQTRDGYTLEPDRTDLAVRVQDLSVTYKTTFEKRPTLKQAVVRFGRGTRAVHRVQALKEVSFEVTAGTTLGVVGANGAGKSTLLRALAGILPPTSGHIETWGKASTMLALGVGFNNALTGRENIILGGLAAGFTRSEVEDRAQEIAEWAEGDTDSFIDRPMRTYSSGQNARVGFSVGVHMDPDILMVDEALSTGDAGFREKASAKLEELREKSRAMFFVSHGLASVRELCNDCIWLDHGRLMMRGTPEDVTAAYLEFLHVSDSETNREEL